VSRTLKGSLRAYDHHRGKAPLLRQTSTFRGFFFVGANLAGFAVANAFLYYLTSGRWIDLSRSSFRRALTIPLTDILLHPLSIFTHPWMIAVTGLLLAAVVFVPVMVSVLYRLWVSVLFLLAVLVFGHSPALAACLAAGSFAAGRTRLRSDLPFLALLTGVLTSVVLYVVLYLLFFAREEPAPLPPFQRPVYYVPFILALLAVMVAGAVVLALAQATRYRPGVIWPVLLVFLAAPVGLFYGKVGPGELEYALIVRDIEPGPAIFRPTALPVGGIPATTGSAPARVDAEALAAAQRRLDGMRQQLRRTCRQFLIRYPDHPRAPAVLWLLAAVGDVQVDASALGKGIIRYTYRGPSRNSQGAWSDLVDRYGASPQATVARHFLGILALRDGRVHKAYEHLLVAQSLLTSRLRSGRTPGPESVWDRVFTPPDPPPGREYERSVLTETVRILWLMRVNRVLGGTAETINAFKDYMELWPFEQVDPARLRQLAKIHRQSPLEDNFRFRAAMAEARDLDRAVKLAALTEEVNDAAIAANYHLGVLAMRLSTRPEWAIMKLKKPRQYFHTVIAAPENPYRSLAEEHLAWLRRSKAAENR